MVRRLIGGSRFLISIAVLCLFIASVALIIYGAVDTYHVIATAITEGVSSQGEKKLLLSFIELTDLFLLATVIYITAAGLFELFIDDQVPLLPDWLQIHDLDDLKDKLIGVVIVVLGVLFLGQVVSWDGQRDLLGYGVAIGVVIAALTWFLSHKSKKAKAPAEVELSENPSKS